MNHDRGVELVYLRGRAEELRIERDHYWQAYQSGLFTASEISAIYCAIAREMRVVATALRALTPAYPVAAQAAVRFSK